MSTKEEFCTKKNDENIFPCLWNTDIQKNTTSQRHNQPGKAPEAFFFFWSVSAFPLCSLCMHLSSLSQVLVQLLFAPFMLFSYKCRCYHNKLSDKMLALLVNTISQISTAVSDPTLISLRWTASLKNININSSKPCLILVLFCFFLLIFSTVEREKALLAVLVPLWHDADTMYSVVLVWR